MSSSEEFLALARARQRAVSARASQRLAKLGSETEEATVARIDRDTRAIQTFTRILKRHPKKLAAKTTLKLPSGAEYDYDREAGKFNLIRRPW
jgi:hypothetical protein